MRGYTWITLGLVILLAGAGAAQNVPDSVLSNGRGSFDTSRLSWRSQIGAGERFDLLFFRGFLINTGREGAPDLVPGRTGTIQLGINLNLPIFLSDSLKRKKVTPNGEPAYRKFQQRLDLQFRLANSFYKLNFRQTEERSPFSNINTDTIIRELVRIPYVELGIGLNVSFHEQGILKKAKSHLEVGFMAGIRASRGVYKIRLTQEADNIIDDEQIFRAKFSPGEANPLRFERFGVYGNFSYSFVSLWLYYRLSGVFRPVAGEDIVSEPNRFEVGIGFHL